MAGFGDRLRQGREERGATIEQVAEATRIQLRHLAALERGDLGALPPGPFAKGYIKTYAQFLELDPLPILEAYQTEQQRHGLDTQEAQERMLAELSQIVAQRSGIAGRPSRRWARGLVLGLGLAAVVAIVAAGWQLSRPEAEAPAPEPESHESAAPAAPPRPAEAQTAPPPRPRRSVSRAALQVADSGVGTAVRNNSLVGRAERFTEGTQVAFWTRVTGGEAGDVIRHVWFHGGQAVMRAELELGGAHWRTYSRRVLPEGATGDWVVEARGPDGGVLARHEFVCVPEQP